MRSINETAVRFWEHFEHQADMGVRGVGANAAEAFQQAALALIAVITDPAGVMPRQYIDISCDAPDLEFLLVDWLNAVIFEMATRRLVFCSFEVEIQQGWLRARAWGEPVDVTRHHPAVEVKGATYTALRVQQASAERWVAQCVVDV